jgi:hypothetical protein
MSNISNYGKRPSTNLKKSTKNKDFVIKSKIAPVKNINNT